MEAQSNENIPTKVLLEEIVRNRNEIKNYIDALEARQQVKIVELKKKIEHLEIENATLKKEVEASKRQEKKNSIVIYGLLKNTQPLTCIDLCTQLNSLLNIKLREEEISNYYFLGKANNSPLKIDFTRYLSKKLVIDNRKYLKGQNVSIVDDLTLQQRIEYKLLREHQILAKAEGKTNCYIKNGKLHVDGDTYGYEDLQQLNEKDEELKRPLSTPSTPTTDTNKVQEIPRAEICASARNQDTPKNIPAPNQSRQPVMSTRYQQKHRNNSTTKK